MALRDRVEDYIRTHDLIEPGGPVTCLVSGGADSTCLWHVLRALGHGVSALHVNHKLRGDESEADADFCAAVLGAEVIELDGRGLSEAELRGQRYSVARDRRRATGHTASDQVEMPPMPDIGSPRVSGSVAIWLIMFSAMGLTAGPQ